MSVRAILKRVPVPGRGGIPLNPEDEEEEEGDNVRFSGQGNPLPFFG